MVALQSDVTCGQQHRERRAEQTEYSGERRAPVAGVIVVAVLHILYEQKGEREHYRRAVHYDRDSAFQQFRRDDVGLFGVAHLFEKGVFPLFKVRGEACAVRNAVDVHRAQFGAHLFHHRRVGYPVHVRDGDGSGGISADVHVLEHEVGGFDPPANERGVGLDLFYEAFSRSFEHGGGGRLGDGALFRLALREHEEALVSFREKRHVAFRYLPHRVPVGEHRHVLTERRRREQQSAHAVLVLRLILKFARARAHGRDDVLLQQEFVRQTVNITKQAGDSVPRHFAEEQVARAVELVLQFFGNFVRFHGYIIA